MFFFRRWGSSQGLCRSSLFRLEKRDGGPHGHLYSLPDPGQLLRSLHILHRLHGHVEKRLAGHGGASLHNSRPHHLLICLQVGFLFKVKLLGCYNGFYMDNSVKKLRDNNANHFVERSLNVFFI